MATKGYAVWKHKQTVQNKFLSRVEFTDGSSNLHCRAIGVGPFWIAWNSLLLWSVCDKVADNGQTMHCPEDYFGVSP